MPLEATHIRFALDLKEKFQVKDIRQYLAGTVYPDSRYVTGIDRELTHNRDILKPEFAKDDFRKGWQVHQICDLMQGQMKKRALFEPFKEKYNGYDEARWVVSTAMKIIQDMNDRQRFPIQEYLSCLEYAYNPNREKTADIKRYYLTVINLYNKKSVSAEDYFQMWFEWGIDEELGLKVKQKTEELRQDRDLVSKIENIYDDMLDNYASDGITCFLAA